VSLTVGQRTMSSAEIEHRPAKKRRFFVDDPEDLPQQHAPTYADTSSRPTSASSTNGQARSSQTDLADIEPQSTNHIAQAFDVDTFRAFTGEDVDPALLQKIRVATNDDLEKAINMVLDGSWKSIIADSRSHSHNQPQGVTEWLSKPSKIAEARSPEPGKPLGSLHAPLLPSMPRDRYIGAFGVAAWSTKSGVNLIKHGELVKIERTKIAPRTKIGRGGKIVQVVGRNQKADVITRFTNARGDEIGRLPEETAKWVSPLLDQKVCRFEGSCVYAPDRLRVNDTIYLQLRAYMLRTAFEAAGFVNLKDDNRATGIFEEKESTEEKDLRLRQVALVTLFDEINLHPTTTNETTAKHKKQGILRAAEMAEQYDKDKSSKPKPSGTSTPPSEEEDGEELEEDQLDALYKKAQSFDFNTPEAKPPGTFTLNLRKYQKQALHWMLSKEKDQKSEHQVSMHPLWEEYTWPTKDADDKPLPAVENQDKFFVNLYSGEISLEFPMQEQNCLGGILADEMGLGKTIEMFSLIHSHQSEVAMEANSKTLASVNSLPRLPQTSSMVEPAPCTTLVVAPMSLLAQWESEAVKASKPGSMRTLVYYGTEKTVNLQTLCSASNAISAPNVIITSYGTVLSEFNQVANANGDRGSHGGLFSVDFFRVILDEAHTIKNRQAKTSKACYELSAKHRWVLTGTPIVNRLEDLFSLVRFLKVEPWSNFSFWKTFITVPFESKDFIRALNVVQTVLEPLVLRRTKDMKTPEGEALVPLPPRKIIVEEVELSKTEREVYDFIFTRAKRAFNDSLQAGTLLKSYTTIFAQILRLRQSCCHPVLTRNKDIVADEEEAAIAAAADANGFADDMDLQELISRFESVTASAEKENESATQDASLNFTTHALRQIQTEASGECPICTEEPMIDPAVTACWHSACKKCLENYINHQTDKGEIPRCFSCRENLNPRDVFEVVKHSNDSPSESPASSESDEDLYSGARQTSSTPRITLRRLRPLSPSASTSAKIGSLLTHLLSLPRNTKSVVFSQFTSFLDLISPQLTRHNIYHLRFDGTMSQKIRTGVLRTFNAENASDPSAPRVLLLSLRAGGVGLNLTAANRVFMMDPWWSFAVEAQAIDRVHRMGQTQKVEVIRFVVKESIEGRMLRVQERKMVVAGTLGVGQSGGGGGDEEKKKRRIEELQMLLG
jgi:DNA repair protein RAD5